MVWMRHKFEKGKLVITITTPSTENNVYGDEDFVEIDLQELKKELDDISATGASKG